MLFNQTQSSPKRRGVLFSYILAVLIALLLSAAFYIGYTQLQQLDGATADLKDDLAKTQRLLSDTRETLNLIIETNQDLRGRLEEAREVQQETREQFSQQVSQLQNDLSQKVDEQTLSILIGQWQSRVARITCSFDKDGGGDKESRASAVAVVNGGRVQFLTNKHVVDKDGYTLNECAVTLPEHDVQIEVEADDIDVSSELDLATIPVTTQLPSEVYSSIQIGSCQGKPAIGQRLLILGYPRTGSEESLTATEGIVSGFEDEYYITSAKIGQGSSGGAAILVEDNCFLGMPTLAVAGRIESLARILPIQVLQ